MQEYASSFHSIIECKNIYQLSTEAKSRKLLSLSQCMRLIADLHPTDKVNVLLDEYDSEKMTEYESMQLKEILETSSTFKDSTFVISVQSVDKCRVTTRRFRFGRISHRVACWNSIPMKVYTLPYTMRNTQNNSALIEVIQEEIGKMETIIYMPKEETLARTESFNFPVRHESFPDKNATDQGDQSEEKSVLKQPIFESDEKESSEPEVYIEKCIDSLARYSGSVDTSIKLKTKHTFYSSQCGHDISGCHPKLIRLFHNDQISINVIRRFIEEICFADGKTKAFFLCNNPELMLAFVDLFKKINLFDIAECFRGTLDKQPQSLSEQRETYSKLLSDDTQDFFILTDNDGCRGLEYEKVFISWSCE